MSFVNDERYNHIPMVVREYADKLSSAISDIIKSDGERCNKLERIVDLLVQSRNPRFTTWVDAGKDFATEQAPVFLINIYAKEKIFQGNAGLSQFMFGHAVTD